MKKILAIVLTLAMLSGALLGCSDPYQEEGNYHVTPNAKSEDPLTGDSFDERLLSYIAAHTEGNYMISPLSFRYALGIALEGANGSTKEELLKAAGAESIEQFAAYCIAFNGFVQRFAAAAKEGDALSVANSIWKSDEIRDTFKQTFVDAAIQKYDASYHTFSRANAVERINAWAKEKTNGLIPKLLPEDYPTEDLVAVLMNALYFKDAFCEQFEKGMTKSGTFTTKSGTSVKKDFMNKTENYTYYADDDTQAVVLRMNGDVNMAFVLGDTKEIFQKLSSAESCAVSLSIPKFELETSFTQKELVEFLQENGATAAFDQKVADFSGMLTLETGENIYISDIAQKTRIKLDETGVEAAAVTAVLFDKESCAPIKPVEFTADRPFTFYIYTIADDQPIILFAGEIEE